MPKLPAGKLDRRVRVQKLSASVDAAGHLDETSSSNWVTIGNRWCGIATRGSREFFRGVEVAAEITHQITMRADTESMRFTEKNRLVIGDRVLNISGPPQNVDEAGVVLRFAAVEVSNG